MKHDLYLCSMAKDLGTNSKDYKDRVEVDSRADLREWLEENFRRDTGLWLVSYKKSADPEKYIPYEEIVEELICFGWIDSRSNKLDEQRSMLWIAPRKPASAWSRPNKERVEKLSKAGLIVESGWKAINQAKEDGTWTVLDAIENLEIPKDLESAFSRYPGSEENFNAFPRSAKRGILEWIATAKREETRAKRVDETAKLAAENIRANQWSKK
jgi:uncharacterized protein YdeI (YjbR/CyaY-like superfamily)